MLKPINLSSIVLYYISFQYVTQSFYTNTSKYTQQRHLQRSNIMEWLFFTYQPECFVITVTLSIALANLHNTYIRRANNLI
jgi:hypothetical protein